MLPNVAVFFFNLLLLTYHNDLQTARILKHFCADLGGRNRRTRCI